MNEVPNIDVADWWFNKVATYGLGLVFTAGVLGMLLWVCFVAIGLLKKWVPAWFESTISSQALMVSRVDRLCDTVECLHDTAHSTHEGVRHMGRAARIAAIQNRAKQNISPEILIHLDNAADALEQGPPKNHRHGDTWQQPEETHGDGPA